MRAAFLEDEVERIEDDRSLLDAARSIHAKLKPLLPVKVFSNVSKVDVNFYITPELEIAVPSVRVLFKKDIRDTQLIKSVLTGGIAHEDGHAYLFPFMTRMNVTYAIIHGYVKARGVKWDESVFHTVENMVSDVFNELILYHCKISGWESLPGTRYHYVFKGAQLDDNRTANPIADLLYTHTKVFSSVYLGKLSQPYVPSPTTIGEHLYNILSDAAKHMNIETHTVSVNSGGLKTALAPLVFVHNMYDVVDEVYDIVTNAVATNKVDQSLLRKLLLTGAPGSGNIRVYWAYYITLSALYRYAVEHLKLRDLPVDLTFDTPKRPTTPQPEVLDGIFKEFNSTDILSPELADYAAKQLLSVALMTSTQMQVIETDMMTNVVRIPWYRRPSGKIDPRSLAMHTVLEWKVSAKTTMPVERKKVVEVRGLPDNVTVVIDESGSTSSESTVLSPIVGVETKVFDVERVTAMAMLYNVLRFSSTVPVNLVRFSDKPVVESGTVASIYDRLKNIRGGELQMGGTEIVRAVHKALELHKDGRTNYFILLTDMAISDKDAEEIKKMVFRSLKLSPVLIIAANAEAPDVLLPLNRYDNVAVVSVKTLNDYPLLEKAIQKLGRLILS